MIPVRGPVHVDPPQGQVAYTPGSVIFPLEEDIVVSEFPAPAAGKEVRLTVAPLAAPATEIEGAPAGIRFRRDRRTEKMLLELLLENVADGEVTVDKALEFFIQE